MQRQTIVVLAVAGALLGGICLMTGVVGGVLIARSTVIPQPAPTVVPWPFPRASSAPAPEATATPPKVEPTPAPSPAEVEAWETRTDPQGFSVSVPRSWKIESDRATGRARLLGPRGEEVLAWPIFVAARLETASAQHLLASLAGKVVSRVQWATPDSPQAGVARARGLAGPGRHAVALFTWATGPEGSAGQVFFAVPGESALDEAVVARILGSFKASGAPAGDASATFAPSYVRWRDPLEGAWTVEVPKGWRAEGGLKRFAPTDVRGEIVVTAPDGLVRVSVGDWEIPTFTEPTRMGVQLGFTEGKWYSPSGTQQFMIRRYLTGLEVGRDYVERKIGQSVASLEVVKDRERPDLVATLEEQARRAAVPGQTGRATAGELAFQGQLGGRPCVGSYFCGTQGTTLQVAGIDPISLWNVVILNGYVAVREKAQLGASVLDHVVQSFELTPEWVRMQQNITMDSARVVHETNVEVSKKISDSYWARSASDTELGRRRSNATLGIEDVTDPASGRGYKVESGSNYYWLDDRGNVVGTNAPGAPAIEFREAVRQP